MGNMSYCRCQNTESDLADVYDNVDDVDDLSDEEKRAFLRIVKLAARIVEDFDYLLEA